MSHSVVGELGSYTCTLSPLGNGASELRTHQQINARMFGIPVYRMDSSNTERWQGDRLLSFYGVTDRSGNRTVIKGEALGDRFVITSPNGTVTTTAQIHPIEPCAVDFLQSTSVLRPDSGSLEPVRIGAGVPTSVVIDGARISVRKYVFEGGTRYTVWIDSRNVPVMFQIDDSTGAATYTLTKCVACGLAGTRAEAY